MLSVDLQPAIVRKGSEIKATATLTRSGPPSDTTATVFIDGKEAARRSVKAGDPDSAAPSFTLPPLEVGVHVARIETPDDNLPIDNAFHFLIRVHDQMPSLVVGSPDDTLFVRTALRTGFGSPSAAVTITPEQITDKPSRSMHAYFSAMRCRLRAGAHGIEEYVKSGGLLVLFPGMKASPDAYKAWTCLPGIPSAIEEVPFSQRNRTLTWDKPQHPLVRPLRKGSRCPRWRFTAVWSGRKSRSSDRLVSMGPGQPLLLDRPFGDGRVLMFAVAADRTWSDFPLSPFYLPLILQCADYGAGVGAKTPFVWATDSLSLSERFPELKGAPTWPLPTAARFHSQFRRPGPHGADGRESERARNLHPRDARATGAKPALAVNLPREESDLARFARGYRQTARASRTRTSANDLETLRRLIEEHRVGRTYGEHLLWLALLLIAVEFVYAKPLLAAASGFPKN